MAETESNNYLEKTPLILPRTPDDFDRQASFTRESERASRVLTFDQAMARAGGLGKSRCYSCDAGMFQYFIIFVFTVVYVSNGYIFYALTYLELYPDYICGTGYENACTKD